MLKKAAYIIVIFALLYLIPNYLHKKESTDVPIGLINSNSVTNTITPTPTSDPEKITMSFVGDILLAGNIENKIRTNGEDSIFAGVKDFFNSRDITIGNLESSVSHRGSPEMGKTYTFRAKPERIKMLKDAGFDAMSLANNHILDYGTEGLSDTISNLDYYGILHGGAGNNRDEAYKPLILRVKGKKVAVLFYSYVLPSGAWHAGDKSAGVASAYNHNDLLNSIEKVRKYVDVVAVYIHWGKERALSPEGYQRNLAHTAIDSGADLVIGTHSHTLQGFEIYKDKLVAYSLGNFVFNATTKNTVALNVDYKKGKFDYYYTPYENKRYTPVTITDDDTKNKIDKALQARSYGVVVEGQVLKTLKH